MGPGPLIAIYVLLLYLFLAPVVLFGMFAFFDSLGRSRPDAGRHTDPARHRSGDAPVPGDPAVWTGKDIRRFRDQA